MKSIKWPLRDLVERLTRASAAATPAPARVRVRIVDLPIALRCGWVGVGAQVDVELISAVAMLSNGQAALVNEGDAVHVLRMMVGLPATTHSNPTRRTA